MSTTQRSLTLFAASAVLIAVCGAASAQNPAARQLAGQTFSEAAPVTVADAQDDKSQQAAPAAPVVSDDQAWGETLKANTPDAYKAYVDAFPSGTFVQIARDRMAQAAPKPGPDAPALVEAPKEPAPAPYRPYHRPHYAYAETQAYGDHCEHDVTAYSPTYYAPVYSAPAYVYAPRVPSYHPSYGYGHSYSYGYGRHFGY